MQLTAEFKYVQSRSESRLSPMVEYGVSPLPTDYAFYTAEQHAEVAGLGKGCYLEAIFQRWVEWAQIIVMICFRG
ncbi:hypothetical protein ALON55S_03809 [Alishewanella longhuensis]